MKLKRKKKNHFASLLHVCIIYTETHTCTPERRAAGVVITFLSPTPISDSLKAINKNYTEGTCIETTGPPLRLPCAHLSVRIVVTHIEIYER